MGRDPLDRPLAAALAVGVLAAGFVLVRLTNVDASGFVVAGSEYVDPQAELTIEDGTGYDGQFYYRLARDPFTREVEDHGIRLDNPSYRHQRIFYPLVAWVLSAGGRPAALPIVLIAINVVALAALGGLGGALARSSGRHALWGLVFGLFPGFLWSLSRDLAEILAAALLLGGVLLVRKKSWAYAAVLLVLAMLTRETTLVFAAGGAVVLAARRERYIFLVPLVSYGVWQFLLYLWWGEAPLLAGRGNVGLPGVGLARFVTGLDLGSRGDLFQLAMLAFVLAVAALAALSLARGVGRGPERHAWVIAAVLFGCLANFVEDAAFLRAGAELYLFSAVLVMTAPSAHRALLTAGAGMAWLPVALGRVVRP